VRRDLAGDVHGDHLLSGGAPGKPLLAGDERRATVALVREWVALRRLSECPRFVDFDPRRNPIPWSRCLLLFIASSTDSATVEHCGDELRSISALAPAAEHGEAGLRGIAATIAAAKEEAMRTLAPVHYSGEQQLGRGASLLYRSVLLPFLDLRGQPRYGLGAASWRVVSAVEASTDGRETQE
jgi:hypothetical protein